MALIPRVIPVLLLKGEGLYKGSHFKNHSYVGDPINTVRIFNDKEVDELALIDIQASVEGKGPNFELLEQIASEAFMPMAYGGGIRTVEQANRVFEIGFEKVIIGTQAVQDPAFIGALSERFGNQSVIVSVDIKKSLFKRDLVMFLSGRKKSAFEVDEYLSIIQKFGAGEVVLNAIDRDGKKSGYDTDLITKVSSRLNIPVIASCGAWNDSDIVKGLKAGASAVAAGSMFVYEGPLNAVLMSYPKRQDLEALFKEL